MNGLETTRAARPKPAMFSCQSGTRRLWRIWGTKPLYRDFPNLQTVLRRVGSKGFYDGENNDCDQQNRRHFVPPPVKPLECVLASLANALTQPAKTPCTPLIRITSANFVWNQPWCQASLAGRNDKVRPKIQTVIIAGLMIMRSSLRSINLKRSESAEPGVVSQW